MGKKGRALEQKLPENKNWIRLVTFGFHVIQRRRPLSTPSEIPVGRELVTRLKL